jgi:hypothetical protein
MRDNFLSSLQVCGVELERDLYITVSCMLSVKCFVNNLGVIVRSVSMLDIVELVLEDCRTVAELTLKRASDFIRGVADIHL